MSLERSWRWPAVLAVVALLAGADCTAFKRFAYSGPGRDGWQHPEQVVEALQLSPGDTVADLGSGGGYFTFRLADAVGPEGSVWAVDVDTALLEYVGEQAVERQQPWITTIEARPDDPLLPEGQVDLLFTCNTYHHLKDRSAYFANVQRYLEPTGRVAIVEFDGGGWFQSLFSHFTPGEEIKQEMEAAGYELEAQYDFLDRQNFFVFRVAQPS
jgi:arsenite methyltransferase